MLANFGVPLAAHAQIGEEWDSATSLEQLTAEYLRFAQAALADRWAALIRGAGLTGSQADQVLASGAYGPLTAALRNAEAHDLNIDDALPKLIAARSLHDASDIAAMLHSRVEQWDASTAGRRPPAHNLIAGLIPRAQEVTDQGLARALNQRENTIEHRAVALLDQAIRSRAPWLRALGTAPKARQARVRWLRAARTVAAYRDRWGITSEAPLDARGSARTIEQQAQQNRAAAAAARASSTARRVAQQQTLTDSPMLDLAHDRTIDRNPGPEP